MRQAVLRALSVVVAIVISAVALEALSTGYLYLHDGRYTPATDQLAGLRNTFIQDVTQVGHDCRYVDTLFPHPYLGFVHHGNPPCGIKDINNIGLFGTDFPSEKSADRFVVLLTGGSVAAQFAQINQNGPRYLEKILNERYANSRGLPFLVLNGGDGAWKQPQQLILFLLYADVVDAVVTLDGYNEFALLGAQLRFEYPASNFLTVNPLVGDDFGQIAARWGVGRVVNWISNNTVLSHSQAAVLVVRALDRFVESSPSTSDQRRTTVESIFALPADWPREKREAWGIAQYRKYIAAMDAVAKTRGVLFAHFIQPVPAIAKKLTEAEVDVVGDLSYRDNYLRMTNALLEMSGPNSAVVSLLDLFANYHGDLYEDQVHLKKYADGESDGYRLMAEAIAGELAKLWKLPAKAAQ